MRVWVSTGLSILGLGAVLMMIHSSFNAAQCRSDRQLIAATASCMSAPAMTCRLSVTDMIRVARAMERSEAGSACSRD
jgi:hypothetical protein